MTPFDFVSSVSHTKKDLMTGTANDELAERDYVPFIVNRALSFFQDVIFYVNDINNTNVDKKLQYYYLFHSLRIRKRYHKWMKKVENEDLELIKEIYNFNTNKALTVLSILTEDQLNELKIMKNNIGGVR